MLSKNACTKKQNKKTQTSNTRKRKLHLFTDWEQEREIKVAEQERSLLLPYFSLHPSLVTYSSRSEFQLNSAVKTKFTWFCVFFPYFYYKIMLKIWLSFNKSTCKIILLKESLWYNDCSSIYRQYIIKIVLVRTCFQS